ncbi:MAG TPA: DUF2284 domain-containing protein [Desulfosalsimonadaceae bacterium]|nr:DUF2284 domain-containing protein [Desulfosalsimonadaceae bacterium]
MAAAEEQYRELIKKALELGATDAAWISADRIVVEDTLAEKCRQPRCPHYGLAKSCPPHVAGPPALREQLKEFAHAIFFVIERPAEELYSWRRRELFQLLHEVAAGTEHAAVRMGFAAARAYAGGSCKDIFCRNYPDCPALSAAGTCRFPRQARPSMSGFGINVAKLCEAAGWQMKRPATDAVASICGLVLIC